MNLRLWICVVLVLVGAAGAGYIYGHSNGVHRTRLDTQYFLGEFARSTDLESYLQQRGQQVKMLELTAYVHAAPGAVSGGPAPLPFVLCVVAGILGLRPLLKRKCENQV
jgi:hypothetical protein